MKIIILFCLFFFSCNADSRSYEQYDYPDTSSEETTTTYYKPKKCKQMQFYCESCTNLVMCIDSEYGYMKEYITCPENTTCLNDECTKNQNPLCDGTADIPFECHVPGLFPDPFDCRKYHYCIPKSNNIINDSMEFDHYEHSCQEENDTEYKYDPKSTYCKEKIEKGCPNWPVPLCKFEGETNSLEENNSIFYVCDKVKGHLYPHLYACPHGEKYNPDDTKCEESIVIPSSPIYNGRWPPTY